ncbi:MAG: hypothetical protein WCE49_05565, partial [Terrimicrobiaceae bacterium]
ASLNPFGVNKEVLAPKLSTRLHKQRFAFREASKEANRSLNTHSEFVNGRTPTRMNNARVSFSCER